MRRLGLLLIGLVLLTSFVYKKEGPRITGHFQAEEPLDLHDEKQIRGLVFRMPYSVRTMVKDTWYAMGNVYPELSGKNPRHNSKFFFKWIKKDKFQLKIKSSPGYYQKGDIYDLSLKAVGNDLQITHGESTQLFVSLNHQPDTGKE